MKKSNDDIPVCLNCGTETIVALFGQHRCLDCGRVWDGSERADTDTFRPRAEEDTTEDVVMDLLTHTLVCGNLRLKQTP